MFATQLMFYANIISLAYNCALCESVPLVKFTHVLLSIDCYTYVGQSYSVLGLVKGTAHSTLKCCFNDCIPIILILQNEHYCLHIINYLFQWPFVMQTVVQWVCMQSVSHCCSASSHVCVKLCLWHWRGQWNVSAVVTVLDGHLAWQPTSLCC